MDLCDEILTRWANSLLLEETPVLSICKSMSDINDPNLPLFSLVQRLEGKKLDGPSPYLPQELAAYEALDVVLQCLRKRRGFSVANLVCNRDFYQQIGVIEVLWEVFLTYGYDPSLPAIEEAKQWYSLLLEKYLMPIANLDEDFRDGTRLCALAHAFFPERLNMDFIAMNPAKVDECVTNIAAGLSIIEEQLGIRSILRPRQWVGWDKAMYFIPLFLVDLKEQLVCIVPKAPRLRWCTSDKLSSSYISHQQQQPHASEIDSDSLTHVSSSVINDDDIANGSNDDDDVDDDDNNNNDVASANHLQVNPEEEQSRNNKSSQQRSLSTSSFISSTSNNPIQHSSEMSPYITRTTNSSNSEERRSNLMPNEDQDDFGDIERFGVSIASSFSKTPVPTAMPAFSQLMNANDSLLTSPSKKNILTDISTSISPMPKAPVPITIPSQQGNSRLEARALFKRNNNAVNNNNNNNNNDHNNNNNNNKISDENVNHVAATHNLKTTPDLILDESLAEAVAAAVAAEEHDKKDFNTALQDRLALAEIASWKPVRQLKI